MKVGEMIEILGDFPDDEVVTVIYPEDHCDDELGVPISDNAQGLKTRTGS